MKGLTAAIQTHNVHIIDRHATDMFGTKVSVMCFLRKAILGDIAGFDSEQSRLVRTTHSILNKNISEVDARALAKDLTKVYGS